MAEMETIGKAKLLASSSSSADGFSLGSVLTPLREAQARGRTPPSSPRQLPIPFSQLPPFLSPLPLSALARGHSHPRDSRLPTLLLDDYGFDSASRSPRLRPGRRRLLVSSAPSQFSEALGLGCSLSSEPPAGSQAPPSAPEALGLPSAPAPRAESESLQGVGGRRLWSQQEEDSRFSWFTAPSKLTDASVLLLLGLGLATFGCLKSRSSPPRPRPPFQSPAQPQHFPSATTFSLRLQSASASDSFPSALDSYGLDFASQQHSSLHACFVRPRPPSTELPSASASAPTRLGPSTDPAAAPELPLVAPLLLPSSTTFSLSSIIHHQEVPSTGPLRPWTSLSASASAPSIELSPVVNSALHVNSAMQALYN